MKGFKQIGRVRVIVIYLSISLHSGDDMDMLLELGPPGPLDSRPLDSGSPAPPDLGPPESGTQGPLGLGERQEPSFFCAYED